jgi:hypothetical protein
MDQSDPVIQQKMKSAYEQLLTAKYISEEYSPSQHWLSAFQKYAEQQGPANIDENGAVRKAFFYVLLDDFLVAQVRSQLLPCSSLLYLAIAELSLIWSM